MRFLSRAIGSLSSNSRTHRATASTDRRRSRIGVESLETRNLLSIAGVTLQYGNLAITGTHSGGNVAKVWIDSATHNVGVSLNGQSEEFDASKVGNVTYTSGRSGGDTFVNSTKLTSLVFAHGSGNHVTGGTGYNFVYFFGNNETYAATGGYSDVWKAFGTGDTIQNPNHAAVVVYSN
jgi:hypothetical protein